MVELSKITSMAKREQRQPTVFRRTTSPVASAANIIQRQNSNDTETGNVFFVVDMDVTSQGEMCEEVSHLSDPTSCMFTTHHLIPVPQKPGRGNSEPQLSSPSSGGGSGKRRLSASNLLKKPLAALIRNHYFGYNKKHKERQLRIQQEPAWKFSSKRRNNNNNSNVRPIEEECKGSPIASQERVPLTLMLPVVPTEENYESKYRYTHHDVENRDPTSNHYYHKQGHQETSRHCDSPVDLVDASLELYQNPSPSWEDDSLLLFDDDQTAAPYTPLELGALSSSFPNNNYNSITSNQKGLETPSNNPKRAASGKSKKSKKSSSSSVPSQSLMQGICCRKESSGQFDSISRSSAITSWIVLHWGYCAIGLSTVIFVIALIADMISQTHEPLVDMLYWAVTSFTTIGSSSGSLFHKSQAVDDGASFPHRLFMILTMLYAWLGVTSFGILCGRFSFGILQESRDIHKQHDAALQRRVLTAFCGPSHRGIRQCTRPLLFAKADQSVLWKSLALGAAMSMLVLSLTWTTGASFFQAVYYAVVTACTLGDNNFATQSQITKVLTLTLIPMLVFTMLRWVIVVANWTVQNPTNGAMPTKDDDLRFRNVEGFLEMAQLEDGLLTRADFLEMVLLSMKKVDTDLILALRDGYKKATQEGSVDMTRAHFVKAALALPLAETKPK